MKKRILLIIFFIGGLLSTQAQELTPKDSINETHRTLILKLGLNMVDSTGDDDPFSTFSNFDQMAFSNNYTIELEYRFSKWFSLSGALSKNKWKAGKGNIDGRIIDTDVKYSAIDLALKLYFDEAFDWFDRNDWLELYLHGGLGFVTQAGHNGTSLNLGPGANFWFSEQFGLNINSTAKWLIDHKEEEVYNSNHFQLSASLMYRFIDNDDDNDGVKNSDDDCPNVPGVATNNGCPEEIIELDQDGDGIVDAVDNCPEVYGTDNGCPEPLKEVDTDGDSVLDSADNCPNIKGLPSNNGCPLPDSDNDGIVDSADKCPTVPGIESNNGCPYEEIAVGTIDPNLDSMMKGVLFNSGNSNFIQESYPVLIEITEIIKQHPDAKFRIEGHTDSVGSYESNKRLSQNRANAIRRYFINSGIPAENLVAEGFGETNPVASNLTKEGRRLNRRVEIIRTK
jgi:OmpA-OmpF porin, OOP family